MKLGRVNLGLSSIIVAAALALFGATSPALAQADQPGASSINIRTEGSGGNIIVTGDRELEKKRVVDALRDIAMRGRTTDRALERFQDPNCPLVAGLGEELGPVSRPGSRRTHA